MFVNQLCFLFVVCLWMSFAHLSVGIFPDYHEFAETHHVLITYLTHLL